ncbi:uncharacterized protein EAE98_005550 [Botrytis deweyae]|uniref:Uncharacterized protein n=1 Tax=Botrytis deweyae TaxID=2478750 RepID=A0ABQ7IM95_9HELO|nr:uncharacterized protein EAE98_005550 [Botrytis deweyae]KAF7928494.1 hypothetical protein EAE98_005550 [Botrytis deweyae]
MLFLQPVNLPNPVFRDIVSNLVILRRNPVSSCSTPQYHPHLQLTPFSQYLVSFRLAPSAPSRDVSQLKIILHKRHARVMVINQ